MTIEDDVGGTEEIEYFDLIPVPYLEINSESQPELEIISDGSYASAVAVTSWHRSSRKQKYFMTTVHTLTIYNN